MQSPAVQSVRSVVVACCSKIEIEFTLCARGSGRSSWPTGISFRGGPRFPNLSYTHLGSDLISALAGLQMHNFSHGDDDGFGFGDAALIRLGLHLVNLVLDGRTGTDDVLCATDRLRLPTLFPRAVTWLWCPPQPTTALVVSVCSTRTLTHYFCWLHGLLWHSNSITQLLSHTTTTTTTTANRLMEMSSSCWFHTSEVGEKRWIFHSFMRAARARSYSHHHPNALIRMRLENVDCHAALSWAA